MKTPVRSLLAAVWLLAVVNHAYGGEFIKGADLSMLQYLEDHGVRFREAGRIKDPFAIFKDHGINQVRLRLFLAPDGTHGQVNTLSYTLRLAKRATLAGFGFMLDFHYSDSWADPGHQPIPAEWKRLPHAQLVERVFAYTRETMAAFRREGCSPEVVEVGNEITNGMMWPDAGPLKGDAKMDNLCDLLKAAIRGVREDDPGGSIKIMIHVDKGGNMDACRWFYDNLQRRDVKFDLIGLSYYPFWHGTLADLQANLASLAQTYQKDIIVVETAYVKSGAPQANLPFPQTPVGQQAFLEELIRVVAATPGGRGKGVSYWAPEWIAGQPGDGLEGTGSCENRALFDRDGNLLPGLSAFQNAAAPPQQPTTPPGKP